MVVRACRARESVLPRQQSFKGSKEISSIENNNESSVEPFFVHVCEWRLNMRTGEVKEKNATTEFSMEFPVINEKFVGLRNRFGYLVVDLEASSISGNYHLHLTAFWISSFFGCLWLRNLIFWNYNQKD